VTPELIRLAVDPLAVRHVRLHTKLVIGAELAAAADERRNDDLAAAVGQHGVIRQFLGIGVGIRDVDHPCHGLLFGLNQNALAMHAVEHRPAHPQDARGVSFREQRRRRSVTHEFERRDGQACVHRPDDSLQFFAGRFAARFRLLDEPQRQFIDARYHGGGEIGIRLQWLGAWQDLRLQ
jgi:hypothetical protein